MQENWTMWGKENQASFANNMFIWWIFHFGKEFAIAPMFIWHLAKGLAESLLFTFFFLFFFLLNKNFIYIYIYIMGDTSHMRLCS